MNKQHSPSFRPWLIVSFTLLAIFVLGSWLHPTGRSIWNDLDKTTFLVLNGSLTSLQNVPGWTALWAFTNMRVFDIVAMLLMVTFLWTAGVTFPKSEIKAGTVRFVVLLLFLLAVREGFHEVVSFFDWGRSGPSLVYEPCVRLSELYPRLNPKDVSPDSFPGDHAAVSMLWAGFTLVTVRNRWTPMVVLLTVFLMLPRLVGGAHSLSDDVVGGGFVTLLTLAIAMGTPVLRTVSDRVFAWVNPLIDRVFQLWPLNNLVTVSGKASDRGKAAEGEREQRPAA
ncbi:MAG: phosphatase PAP2 family protein [Fuerstiella sp.]|jgi:membrane-associated phospholipid phosphatase|nr:phosphatase PAP2 family protein [Fuerstiella sp.]MCP4507864.1 phosphatase PAP2 family protein [Fuerstiella sp.]MDG2128795.1 phosphatase PAP2 family protein [Fuerstiella sp.]